MVYSIARRCSALVRYRVMTVNFQTHHECLKRVWTIGSPFCLRHAKAAQRELYLNGKASTYLLSLRAK